MINVPLVDCVVVTAITAVSAVAAMGLLGLDALWLLGEGLPMTGRQLLEWQIAPLMACGLTALGAWTGHRDRRHGDHRFRINKA